MPFRHWLRSPNPRPDTRPVLGRLRVELLDDRTTPAALLATGADAGDAPTVTVYDAATQQQAFTISAYDSSFTGGVNTAVGDVTGDGVPDIVTGPGAGGGPDVRVYSGTDGGLVASLGVGDAASTAGATVAVADFDADGVGDLVLGGVQNGAPLVQVVRFSDRAVLHQYAPATGTAAPWVAAGDVTGDGVPDVVVGAGLGSPPRVIVYDSSTEQPVMDLDSFEETFTGGVRVSTGDLDADGRADVITAAAFLGGPRVQVFSGSTQAVLQNFFAYDSAERAGVWAVASDTNGDGALDVLTTDGSGQSADPKSFSAADLSALAAPAVARAPAAASFDTTAPAATVAAPAAAGRAGPLAFTVTFSEPVSGFSQAGVVVTNGGVAGLTKVDGKTYTVEVTPSGDGDVTVGVAAAAAFDAAGNANAASGTASSQLDSTAPVVTANTLAAAGTTPTLTGTVDDPAAAVSVAVGGQTIAAAVSGTTWSATVPAALAEGRYDVVVSATDAAGNVGTVTATGALTIGTTAPAVAVAVASAADDSTAVSPIPFTVTFSEPVSGFAADKLVVANGAVYGFAAVDGSTYAVTVLPAGPGVVTVTVPAGAATGAGGAGNTASDPASRTYTGAVTTATVAAAGSGTSSAAALAFTVTFSGDVTGFTADKPVAANGTVASVTPIDARTYTVTVTPAADGTVTLTVPAGAATDAAGGPTAGGVGAATASGIAPAGVTNSAGLSTTIPSPTADGWSTQADGLRIRDVTTGSGDAITSADQTVTVHYTGWLTDGTQFDSSASGSPATFDLSGLIPGWREGLIGMKVGGVRDLYVPSVLGYGDQASGLIPAGSDLVFEIKLIAVSS